ncbi:MAG: DNA mismatch repair endonuclease MutL [Pseudomonadales bacterium]
MTGRIHELGAMVANQIAAGEVVERPASLVKELIENSLDAGASEILVVVEEGGVKRVLVRDDGVGIHADDLSLALRRHATSKIRSADDLAEVVSLGFRGEALASMASVARVTVTSRTATAAAAAAIAVAGSDLGSVAPASHPFGTTVEVRDLFFNTPARRKFLKSERTELAQIDGVVRRTALAHPEVGFELRHGADRPLLALPSSSAEQRVARLLGAEFVRQSVVIDTEALDMRLHGWIAQPTWSRSQPDQQFFYVNGRVVRDKLIGHAVRQAYRDVLYGARHPVFVLFLELPPGQVDVNVHPTKHEVRFRDARTVHDFIFGRLNRALRDVRPDGVTGMVRDARDTELSPTASATRASVAPVGQSQPLPLGWSALPSENVLNALAAVRVEAPPAAWSFTKAFAPAAAESRPVSDADLGPPPLGYAIGLLHGIYILAQNAHGLVLVDMHAAHERVMHEALKRELESRAIVRQRLLVPLVLDVTEPEADRVELHGAGFETLGLVLERSGPMTVTVREVPVLLADGDIAGLVRDLLSDLAEFGDAADFAGKLEERLANIAGRAAGRAHRSLTLPEMNALLRTMERTDNAGQCSHGRPTYRIYRLEALDQLFLRGQ